MRRIMLGLFALLWVPLACAQGVQSQWEEGKHYFRVNPPQTPVTGDKIEVLEVFSYACVHCANFEPQLANWKQTRKPDHVEVLYMPAAWNPTYEFYARAFYTAETLKVLEASHMDLFNALHVERQQIRSLDDLAAFYAKYDVKPETFKQTAGSFAVETKLKRAVALVPRYGVRGTPAVIVDGKYRFDTASSGGTEQTAFALMDYLVARATEERRAMASAEASAP